MLASASALGLGDSSACAVILGKVGCWVPPAERRGDALRKQPATVRGLPDAIVDTKVGSRHACAITTSGAVWCWGENQNNYLGNLDREEHAKPVAVSFDE